MVFRKASYSARSSTVFLTVAAFAFCVVSFTVVCVLLTELLSEISPTYSELCALSGSSAGRSEPPELQAAMAIIAHTTHTAANIFAIFSFIVILLSYELNYSTLF